MDMNTLVQKSIRYVLCILLASVSLLTFAGSDYDNNPQAIVSSKSKLNVRSGPGTNFNVVGQLSPGETVYVTNIDNTSNGWTEIRTQTGVKGYVSDSYLSGNYVSAMNSAPSQRNYDDMIGAPPFSSVHSSFYASLLRMDHSLALIFLLIVCMIETGIIIWLNRKYTSFRRISPLTAYIVLILSAILTLPAVPLYDYAIQQGTWAIIVFSLMLLSTGCLMLHSAWRIKLCGMYMGKRRQYDSNNFQAGRWIGNILWFIILIPFANIWWDICDVSRSNYYHTGNSFGNMLLTLLCMVAVNLVFIKFVWSRIIVKYLFHIANQGIVHIMSFILCCGILSYEYSMIDYNFKGIIFFFAIAIYIPVLVGTFGYAWSSITEHRCANCHSYSTRQTGFTDLGNTYRKSKNWEDINESAINRRISGSTVTDARKLVSTTETVNHWRTHHTCYNCSNTWDMDYEATVDKSSRGLKKKWTEHY